MYPCYIAVANLQGDKKKNHWIWDTNLLIPKSCKMIDLPFSRILKLWAAAVTLWWTCVLFLAIGAIHSWKHRPQTYKNLHYSHYSNCFHWSQNLYYHMITISNAGATLIFKWVNFTHHAHYYPFKCKKEVNLKWSWWESRPMSSQLWGQM